MFLEGDGRTVITQTSCRLLIEEVDPETTSTRRQVPIEAVTFCKTYNPRYVWYHAYWDTKKLWVAERGQFKTSLHPGHIEAIQRNWRNLNQANRDLVEKIWSTHT
jgi:hypothetical protein